MVQESIISSFRAKLENDPSKSTSLATVETLLEVLDRSRATTVAEFQNELNQVVAALEKTDYSSTSIRSAADLFTRFTSLAPAALLDQEDFSQVLDLYRQRARSFIKNVRGSRAKISKCARLLFTHHMNILTHSYSKVVLETILDAHKSGYHLHIWVTESQPDASGKRMCDELKKNGVPTTLVLDSCVGYVMERIQAVLIGAEGVMETGGIINKIGTVNVCVIAKARHVPVYVCAETIKFVREFPLNQADIPKEFKYRTSVIEKNNLELEHPDVDYTAPEFLTLIITDVGAMKPEAVGEELIKMYI
uniref:Translation initiation factor eIF2B subunit alpha n=1 Tax=Caenorhabditis tropicalis TaxID=1561998 RepID=A0A1I7UQM3_9PELO